LQEPSALGAVTASSIAERLSQRAASTVAPGTGLPRSASAQVESPLRGINCGFFAAALVAAALVAVVSLVYVDDWRPLAAVVLGLVLASGIQLMTSYYTATEYKPVQEIADASEAGPTTTILSGFSTGLESTVYAVLAIVGAIIGAVLLGAGDPRGRPGRRPGRVRGPQAVPRPPGDHGLQRAARLQRGGGHLHPRLAT